MVQARNHITATIVVGLIIVAIIYSGSSLRASAGPAKMFGFTFMSPGGLRQSGYDPTTFFNAYFLTPPYPSTIELLMNNYITDITSADHINYVLSLMQQASAYPNIKLVLHFSFDVSSSTEWKQFESVLAQYANSSYKSSIGAVGFYFETVNVIVGQKGTKNSTYPVYAFDKLQFLANRYGFQFVSSYRQGWPGGVCCSTNYLWWAQTNYPTGDTQANLNDGIGDSTIVGQFVDGESLQIWPSKGCFSDFSEAGYPAWTIASLAEGYLATGYNNAKPCHNGVTNNGYPPTIDQVLSTEAALPSANRQYVMLDAGHAANGYGALSSCGCGYVYFTGVSGLSTHWLWDNPLFRRTMANSIGNHSGSYITSNGLPATTSSMSLSASTITRTLLTTTTTFAPTTTTFFENTTAFSTAFIPTTTTLFGTKTDFSTTTTTLVTTTTIPFQIDPTTLFITILGISTIVVLLILSRYTTLIRRKRYVD